ncbi:MAG: VIT1/CCC1 transporter family protein [Candidatus Saccharimonadales bacterium]
MANINREYLRSVVFGVEDSLVSTTGLIAGLSAGAASRKVVVLGAIVAMVVEAISMGAGEYLSDDAVQDLDKLKRPRERPSVSGLLMFTAYFLAGFVPLVPVLLLTYPGSVWVSVIFALCGLFVLGYLKGRVLKTSPFRGGLKILVVGGLATLLGVVVGLVFRLV